MEPIKGFCVDSGPGMKSVCQGILAVTGCRSVVVLLSEKITTAPGSSVKLGSMGVMGLLADDVDPVEILALARAMRVAADNLEQTAKAKAGPKAEADDPSPAMN